MHVLSGPLHLFQKFASTALKLLAYGLATPILLVAVLVTLPYVLLDFTWFRTREMLLGNPQPKRLWEF
jgi:hypothetical protein